MHCASPCPKPQTLRGTRISSLLPTLLQLPDDLYYRELDAKNKALMELTDMLGKTTAGKQLIGKRGSLTFHCIWTRSMYQEWGEDFQAVGPDSQDGGSDAREQSRTWPVKFYG